MPWWAWLLLTILLLLGAPLAVYGAACVTGEHVVRPVNLTHRGIWVADHVIIYPDHWLPRLVRSMSIGRRIWLRYGPPPHADWPLRKSLAVTQRWQMGHELGHYYRWIRVEDLHMALRHLWGILAHLRNKVARPEEHFAYLVQHAIAVGTFALLRCPGDWLAKEFPHNFGDPDDPGSERRIAMARPLIHHSQKKANIGGGL